MSQNINQNGNFHTPLSPMRFQSSMGKQVTRRYKDGKNMVRLSLARVTKVNYKYNTVEVVTIKHKNSTTKNPNDNGRYSARLPIQFGGQTPDGKVFGTNTLVTQGALVLIGFLEGSKDNPIVINIYGAADSQSMLTRTTYNGADESDEELQKELWQLFTLYPSMTYQNIDGHGNQEITFPGKTFFYTSADDQKVNDAFFDYDHLPSAYYANGDLIEPTVPDAPNMLLVHQGVYDKHRVTFFIKSDGTVRMGSRHADGQGVTFYQLGTDGSFRIQQTNDSVNPEDESSNFSSMSIEEDGSVVLQAGEHKLAIGPNGITLDGGTLSGGNIDLTGNETIKDMQGDIITLQKATTATGIVSVVTESSGWQDLNSSIGKKTQTYITQPIPPYNVGDVWEDNGTIYVCTNPEPIGATFVQTDWKLAGDVTANNTAADTSKVGGTDSSTVLASISSAAAVAADKAQAFNAQPVPPYSLGDIWTYNNAYYSCIHARLSGEAFNATDWVIVADKTSVNTASDTAKVNGVAASTVTTNITNAQNTANSKAQTFISQPNPPYNVGDIWVNNGKTYVSNISRPSTASFLLADWVLQGDVTGANTAADTSKVGGTASSTVLTNITTAQSTADSKSATFTTQPRPPYAVGDLWNNNGTMYTCMNAKANNGTYDLGDWDLTADVTANNTAADTAKVGGTSSTTVLQNITTAQSTADSKSATYTSQPAPPYKVGDLWKNGQTVSICTTARATGSFSSGDWILTGDVTANNTAADTANVGGVTATQVNQNITNAQTTANSKAKGFVTQPVTPYSLGDVWNNNGTVYICTTARASGAFVQTDWTLSGDVTANNTSADTSKVNGVAAATVQQQAQAGAMLTQDPGFTQGLWYLSADDATASAGSTLSGTDYSVVASAGVTGGNVIQIKNSHWIYSKYAYPVDTSHTYKVRFRVRQTIDGATGLMQVYAGLATYDNTGTLQTGGPGTHRWIAASGVGIATADGWHYFEGTITGVGSTTNTFRTGTASVKLAIIVNYSGGTGTVQVDTLELVDITQQVTATAYTDTSVNGLVIGGRNYLKNTSNMNDLTNWTFNLGSNIVGTLNIINDSVYNGVLDFNITQNNNVSNNWIVIENTGLTLPNGKFIVGNYYTLSFLMKNDLSMYVEFCDDTGLNPVASRSSTIPVSSTWRPVVYTFKATATGNIPVFYLSTDDQTSVGHVYVTNLQLEDGNKATGYNPAPEDVQNQIDATNEQMNTITTGQFMGNANYGGLTQGIINTVTSSSTYSLAMTGKADKQDLTGLATSTEVANAQGAAQDYADKKVAGIDFSPYVKNQTYVDDAAETQRTYTSSGGVNMLQNSVGFRGTDYWNTTLNANGTISSSSDPAMDQYGSFSGFAINGGMLQQTVTVTPNVPYTLGVIINKGISGDAYIKLDDGQGVHQTFDFPDGTAYPWPTATIKQKSDGTSYAYVSPFSINITPTSSSLTVTLYSDAAVPATVFTCVMLNVGSQPFTWQQHMGEVYNANITFDDKGIRVSHTDESGKLIGYTVMTPSLFAGYQDTNGDGTIDSGVGSVDEIFRMDQDTFVMKSSTIGPIKIVPVTTGGYNGIAFIKSS